MARQNGHGALYAVHAVGKVAKRIQQLQRRAERQGRGAQFLVALKHIYEQLQQDPNNIGEPLYRLSKLRLHVRTCSVRPLVVDFAVHDELPLVFLKGVWLLPE